MQPPVGKPHPAGSPPAFFLLERRPRDRLAAPMSSRSLIIWFALIAGLELGVRGHLEAAPLRHSAG